MRIKYFEDTDTTLVEFSNNTPAETLELNENIYLDIDSNGRIVSITIEHAGQSADMREFIYERLPANMTTAIREPGSEYLADFQVELPSSLLQLGLSKDDIQGRIVEWVVLLLFTEGRISSGKAARLLNMNRLEFIALLKARGISYVNYPPEELEDEIKTARGLTLRAEP